jgi:hypothetical protein
MMAADLYVVNAPVHPPYWWERNGTGIPPSGVAPIATVALIPTAAPTLGDFVSQHAVLILFAAGALWLLSSSPRRRR